MTLLQHWRDMSNSARMPSREQLCYRRGIVEASTSRLHKSSPDVHQSPPDLPRAREEGLRRPSSGTNQSARSKSRTAQLAVSADTTSHSASGKASPKIVSPRSPDVEMLTWETREAANTLMRQRLEMYRACLAAESMERPSPPGRDGGMAMGQLRRVGARRETPSRWCRTRGSAG